MPLVVLLMVTACGNGEQLLDAEQQAQVDAAELDTQSAVQGLSIARTALEVFGVLPSYSCGPLNDAIGKAIPPVSLPLACMTVTTRGTGLDLVFGEHGCDVAGHRVTGTLALELALGESRIDATADLRSLVIDGQSLPVRVGMGVCGDEKRVWATVDTVKVGERTFALDAHVGVRRGLPIIGSTTILLDGTGSLAGSERTDVAADGLEYDVGEYAPKAGTLTVNRSDGSSFSVRFTEVLWKLGKAEVTIDDRAPVEVLVVQ